MTPDRDQVQKALDEFSLTDHGDQCYIMFHALNGLGNAITIQRDDYKALLEEAIDALNEWGGYASPYFQDKWDLKGDIARWKARLDVLSVEGDQPEVT